MSDAVGFWTLAETEPDRMAVVGPDGREVTYGELGRTANQLVHGLREAGVPPGGGIALVMPNSIEVLALYFAALQAGWYITPINHHLVGPEIAFIVEDSEADVFVAHERFADACASAAVETSLPPEQCFAVGDVPGFRPFAELTEGQLTIAPEDRAGGQAMHYTSGTTGKPKGVRRKLSGVPPDASAVGSQYFLGMFGVKPGDDNVHLCGSPLYHTAVLAFVGASLHLGHPVVLMDRWTPESMLELIDRYKVTSSHMVPTQFHRLLALPDDVKARYDVSSTRSMVHAAAPCPVEIKQRMLDWWGPSIWEYYAATEGGGTVVSPEQWLAKPGTVGLPWPSSEIRVLDDDDQDAPPGVPGTVYMKLATADFEYFKDRDKTEANRKEGFFTVGDIGYLDEDGYLFLNDRKSDMIISGGVNIYPAEIEGAFLTHPKVADAAVFGIPHPDWGEEIKAVVEAAPGAEPGDELTAELLAHCAERLAKFKLPKSIDYTTEMPRDPNGKLYKRKLRDPYWADRATAI
ncbi:acyl-CoA synthetase [Iamia sp. SCSIO 61187]|uniref:acyl-CoA synthetase n=1 Tax=Iamia sp. SCSIO 61187 TaxID=2722752 RepID=UPI001C636242|nr:acyl-CoA synthetase [Iamia sp. SCSIO 61187]QYG93624.1 acyl-CoA synthetase [Iamia sp. SCSIO 61187]